MDKRKLAWRLFPVIGIVFLSCVLTTPGNARSSSWERSTLNNSIVIFNSGSTNTCTYTVQVTPTGSASYSVCNTDLGQQTLPVQLAYTFFQDVDAAQPLSNIPVEDLCSKPISFASKTYIIEGSDVSPDVSCASSQAGKKLDTDAQAIIGTLQLPIIK